jgi:hypothetical protein
MASRRILSAADDVPRRPLQRVDRPDGGDEPTHQESNGPGLSTGAVQEPGGGGSLLTDA